MSVTEVTIPGSESQGDPPSPAVASLPAGAVRGMVVIHEVYGRQPEIDRVVERFATAGYATVAPDLFFEGKLRCIRRLIPSLSRAEDTAPVRQALRARQWLCGEARLPVEKVGLIGFCFGGMFVLAAGRGWGAVSANYPGRVPSAVAMKGIGPVMACFGGRDRSTAGYEEMLTRRLARVAVTPESHVYPDAGHSFLTDGRHPVAGLLMPFMHLGFHEPSATDAWPKILGFFGRNL
jgi:carboxymethylenebutenolidase